MPGRPGRPRPASGSASTGGAGAAASARDDLGRGPGVGRGDGADEEPADPEAIARLICLRMLTAAPRTRAQLAEALRRRRVPEDAATAVLGRFAEVGLIDDAMFASAWVESRHHGRGLGRHALAAELDRRGVARRDIQEAVARLSPETEIATARALVERKLASLPGQPPQAQARKLVGMLARKGYPPGTAYRAVREALERADRDSEIAGLDDNEPFDAADADSEPDCTQRSIGTAW